MSNPIKKLQNKIDELSARIEDTKKRLPAHSTKPPIMMELLDLEDEYDALCKQLNQLKGIV